MNTANQIVSNRQQSRIESLVKKMLAVLQKAFLLLYVFLMPLENVLPASLGGSFIKYVGLFMIAINTLIVLQKSVLFSKKGLLIITVFCLYALLSILWSKNGINTSYFTIIMNMFLFTITSSQININETFFRTIFKVLLASGVIVSLMVIFGIGLSSTAATYYGETRRTIAFAGSNVDNNNLATMFCLQFIAGFFLFLRTTKKRYRILYFVLCSLILIAIFYTGSRGSLVGLALAFVVYFFTSKTKHKVLKTSLAALILLAIFYLMILILPASITQRFSIESVLETGGSGRFDIWKDAFNIFKNAPLKNKLFGYGWSSFPYVMKSSYNWFVAAHNDFVEVLIELGIFGLILYVSFFIMFFAIARKKDRCLLLLLVVVFCSSFSMELLVKKMLWMVILFILIYPKKSFLNVELIKKNKNEIISNLARITGGKL